MYCQRGEMENRIKEQQLGLFADRTSCHRFVANQFRLLLSSAAYVLVQTLRRTVLRGTSMARAQVGTIRLTLLKVAARVLVRAVCRVTFHLASSYPYRALFQASTRARQAIRWMLRQARVEPSDRPVATDSFLGVRGRLRLWSWETSSKAEYPKVIADSFRKDGQMKYPG